MQKGKVNQQQQPVAAGLNRSEKSFKLISMLLLGSVLTIMFAGNAALAGQGCPFDDGSCREYCNQQGCNMGYCGHFAWIQCICRKCGDEWSWYDKVRYNPDKTVNQTELDSLKLNGTAPIILTNSSDQQQQQVVLAHPNKSARSENKQQTLTTLLIPDLSDTNGKSELNDIPDENSDKFLDYLAKNHEKLVQATASRSSADSSSGGSPSSSSSQQTPNIQNKQITTVGIDLDDEHENQEEPESQSQGSDETIEIQISTSNNSNSKDSDAGQLSTLPKIAPATANQAPSISTSSTTSPPAPSASHKQQSGAGSESESKSESQEQAMTKLLKMAVIERASEDID